MGDLFLPHTGDVFAQLSCFDIRSARGRNGGAPGRRSPILANVSSSGPSGRGESRVQTRARVRKPLKQLLPCAPAHLTHFTALKCELRCNECVWLLPNNASGYSRRSTRSISRLTPFFFCRFIADSSAPSTVIGTHITTTGLA